MTAFLRRHPALNATALFVFAWAVARAHLQGITGDESDSFLFYVARPCCAHWMPSANNHVLNSMLMRLFTDLFGPWHLPIRMPALLGAGLYLASAHRIVRWLSADAVTQWILYACLTLNPFFFDYFVAARGYGLATGCLLCAICAAVTASRPLQGAMWMSAFLGLAFAANFSFAVVGSVLLVLLTLWLLRHSEQRTRVAFGALVPGAVVTIWFCGWNLLKWPKDQLGDGVDSVAEMLRSVFKSSLYEVNPALVSPLLMPFMTKVGRLALIALGATVAVNVVMVVRERSRWRESQAPLLLAGISAMTLTAGVAGHWLVFHAAGVLYPHDRTAIWVAVLCTLLAGSVASIPTHSSRELWARRTLLGVMAVLAFYDATCLRLNYFREWEWGSEAREAYWAVAYYNHHYCVGEIAQNWLYTGSLNYYREVSGRETFGFFQTADVYPTDRSVYVLHSAIDAEFISRHGLQTVFRGRRTAIVVAVNPDLLARRSAGCSSPSQ